MPIIFNEPSKDRRWKGTFDQTAVNIAPDALTNSGNLSVDNFSGEFVRSIDPVTKIARMTQQ